MMVLKQALASTSEDSASPHGSTAPDDSSYPPAAAASSTSDIVHVPDTAPAPGTTPHPAPTTAPTHTSVSTSPAPPNPQPHATRTDPITRLASDPIQSNPIQSNPIQSNPVQSNPIQSNPTSTVMSISTSSAPPPVSGNGVVDTLKSRREILPPANTVNTTTPVLAPTTSTITTTTTTANIPTNTVNVSIAQFAVSVNERVSILKRRRKNRKTIENDSSTTPTPSITNCVPAPTPTTLTTSGGGLQTGPLQSSPECIVLDNTLDIVLDDFQTIDGDYESSTINDVNVTTMDDFNNISTTLKTVYDAHHRSPTITSAHHRSPTITNAHPPPPTPTTVHQAPPTSTNTNRRPQTPATPRQPPPTPTSVHQAPPTPTNANQRLSSPDSTNQDPPMPTNPQQQSPTPTSTSVSIGVIRSSDNLVIPNNGFDDLSGLSDGDWLDEDNIVEKVVEQVGISYSAPVRLCDLLTPPLPKDFYDPGIEEGNADSSLLTPICNFGSMTPEPISPPSPLNIDIFTNATDTSSNTVFNSTVITTTPAKTVESAPATDNLISSGTVSVNVSPLQNPPHPPRSYTTSHGDVPSPIINDVDGPPNTSTRGRKLCEKSPKSNRSSAPSRGDCHTGERSRAPSSDRRQRIFTIGDRVGVKGKRSRGGKASPSPPKCSTPYPGKGKGFGKGKFDKGKISSPTLPENIPRPSLIHNHPLPGGSLETQECLEVLYADSPEEALPASSPHPTEELPDHPDEQSPPLELDDEVSNNFTMSQIRDTSQIFNPLPDHDSKSNIVCGKCGLSIRKKSYNDHHISGVCGGKWHIQNELRKYVSFKGNGYYICQYEKCNYFSKDKRVVKNHFENCHSGVPKICPKVFGISDIEELGLNVCGATNCGQIFFNALSRHNHFTHAHKDLKLVTVCGKCNDAYKISSKKKHDKDCGINPGLQNAIQIYNKKAIQNVNRKYFCRYKSCNSSFQILKRFVKHIWGSHCRGYVKENLLDAFRICCSENVLNEVLGEVRSQMEKGIIV